MHSKDWPEDHLNIAEIFIPPGWSTLDNINLKDLSTQLAIWSKCSEVPTHISDKSNHMRVERNNLVHTTHQLSEAEKITIFQKINSFIRDPDIYPIITDFDGLCSEIKGLENNELHDFKNNLCSTLKEISTKHDTSNIIHTIEAATLIVFFAAFVYIWCPNSIKTHNLYISEYRHEGKFKFCFS